MGKIKDLSNQKFGRLTAIYLVGIYKDKGGAIWHCRCDCGKEVDVRSNLLSGKHTQSCGCINSERAHGWRFKDITGMVFNRLTAISYVGKGGTGKSIWRCRCSCGNEIDVTSDDLIQMNTQSCGCYRSDRVGESRFKDLTGMVFYRLTVVEFVGMDKWGNAKWKCICSCGKGLNVVVSGGKLTSGHTRSCGCYRIERDKEAHTTHGQSKTKEYQYTFSNKRRERKDELDTEWTTELGAAVRQFFNNCVVCGSVDNLQIDHVKPLSKGYGLRADNAVLLCRKCNLKKHAKMPSELPVETREKIERASAEFWEYCANKGFIKGSVILGGG